MERWIKPALGGKRLRELEPEHVEQLLATMVAAGKSRRTVARVKSYLGQALAAAERRGKVRRNVARIAEMPATKAPAERRFLSPDEGRKVLKAARGDRLEALFVTALMLGLRGRMRTEAERNRESVGAWEGPSVGLRFPSPIRWERG